jgi:hypothetical protein
MYVKSSTWKWLTAVFAAIGIIEAVEKFRM